MEQKDFTDFIISGITKHFPEFQNHCTKRPNDIVDIDFKSQRGKLALWLTTQDAEVTIGFTGKNEGECDWHTHMSVFSAYTPEEELQVAIELIENILTDKEVIIHSTQMGYFLTDNFEDVVKYQQEGETITKVFWSDL